VEKGKHAVRTSWTVTEYAHCVSQWQLTVEYSRVNTEALDKRKAWKDNGLLDKRSFKINVSKVLLA